MKRFEDGFFVAELVGRTFEVCWAADRTIYVRACDSGPIPWEDLDQRRGTWTEGYVSRYPEPSAR